MTGSPGGQARGSFAEPFSPLELENFVLTIQRAIGDRAVRSIDSPQMARVKDFGDRLFRSVFDGEVAETLRSSLDEASRQDAGLRLRLHLADDAQELANIPWEFLYSKRLNRFLARTLETPLVRYLDIPEIIRPLAVTPPLKVLVLISSPDDHRQLDVEGEWTKLQTAVSSLQQRGRIELEMVRPATLDALRGKLRTGEYHVMHFIGHGGFDEQQQDGVVLFEDNLGHGRKVSGQYLGELLRGPERRFRLAILNSCEGARSGAVDPFAGAAQSLIQQGFPAVIAMQFEITDGAAMTLTGEFYEALSEGYPVDAALAEARRAIFEDENEIEWATPVLYMRSPDGVIFDVSAMTETARAEAAREAEERRLRAEEEARAEAAKEAEERRLRAEEEARAEAARQAEERRLRAEEEARAEAAKEAEERRLRAEEAARADAAREAEERRRVEEEAARAAAPPPMPEQPTLAQVLPGQWQVQITNPMGGVGQGTMFLAPGGAFNGEITGFFGAITVNGAWQVLGPSQFGLQGQQSNGFQFGPYSVMTQVTQLAYNQISGRTGTGEQFYWTRIG
ncbi:MAG TPA: CHAT domain-containing protein [Acidimicrobiia bacterium]|nr:CHAT domain-containing protein [Acidimicrobiia bacterium]